jgi:2-polyprenyl-3-methyl-5-hydroxy-6-metoxy-1,4-benzoquinol methylase
MGREKPSSVVVSLLSPLPWFALSALAGAHHSGVLAALVHSPGSAAELAQKLGLAEGPIQLLLDGLVKLGVANRQGERHAATPELRALDALLPGGLAVDGPLWGHIQPWLRDGRPYTGVDQGRAADLWDLWLPAARALAERLEIQPRRVLDVGCGSGLWSLVLAEREPDTLVAGLDLPNVIPVFEAQARRLGLTHRVTAIAADALQVAVPEAAYDLVILANVLRLETADQARNLVSRWSAAIAPGGALLVVDALAEGSPRADLAQAFYALHLALRSRSGGVHPASEVRGWLEAEKLSVVKSVDLTDVTEVGALGALLATR